jgi:AcrR family transcriptional regulator
MDGERVGLRERKKQQTRIALSWAAIRLTVERGLDNVRTEDIAAAAGVSPRTFDNYFSSKGEAIASRHLDRARRIARELRARPASESIWEAITAAVLTGYPLSRDDEEHGLDDRQWTAGVRLMVAEPKLQVEFVNANVVAAAEFASAIAERTGTDVTRDLYPQLMAAAVGAAINTATAHWLRADPPVPMDTLLRNALEQLAAGLPVPPS